MASTRKCQLQGLLPLVEHDENSALKYKSTSITKLTE